MMKTLLILIASLCSLCSHANDLTMFCLKGPVDSVCIIMNDAGLEWQTEFTFDEDGYLTELDGSEIDCTRDESGRMKSIIVEDALEDDEDSYTTIKMTLHYDATGHVVKVVSTSSDETWTQNYRYNKDGLTDERDYDSDNQDEIQKYVYLKFDNYGNWTERLEKFQSMDQVITQTRNITYRK